MAETAAAISNLGYVVLGVKDLGAWADFAHNLMGFHIASRDDGNALVLRMDEHMQRIVLEKSEADDIQEAGWEFETEDELNRYAAQLRERGIEVTQGDRDYCVRRRVEKLYHCKDPNGYRHAFYFGPEIAQMTNPFRSSVMRGPGFETGTLGIGHILTTANNYEESVDFYRSVMGLRVSDYIREERAPGIEVGS